MASHREVSMPHTPRIGNQIEHADPFWVQVPELVWQWAKALSAGRQSSVLAVK
jgi:hypothetical protein